ncbi:hypothetical protein [Scytonema sp. PRP1]
MNQRDLMTCKYTCSAAMGVGIASAMTWSLVFKWSSIAYQVLPGMPADA